MNIWNNIILLRITLISSNSNMRSLLITLRNWLHQVLSLPLIFLNYSTYTSRQFWIGKPEDGVELFDVILNKKKIHNTDPSKKNLIYPPLGPSDLKVLHGARVRCLFEYGECAFSDSYIDIRISNDIWLFANVQSDSQSAYIASYIIFAESLYLYSLFIHRLLWIHRKESNISRKVSWSEWNLWKMSWNA